MKILYLNQCGWCNIEQIENELRDIIGRLYIVDYFIGNLLINGSFYDGYENIMRMVMSLISNVIFYVGYWLLFFYLIYKMV